MKKIISILVLAAMMLTTVLAVVPASAAEIGGSSTTYTVNWKSLHEGGKLRSQWCYDTTERQNDYNEHFTVTATDTEFSTSQKGDGEARSIYSTLMFDITANTYYQYEFEAKNISAVTKSNAGIVFAYATNPNAYTRGTEDWGDGVDAEGAKTSPYCLQGVFQNSADVTSSTKGVKLSVFFGHDNYDQYKLPVSNTDTAKTATGAAGQNTDGYVKYKIIYNGLNVKVYYNSTVNTEIYTQAFDVDLPEGAKVAFGVFGRDNDTVSIRNCKITSRNTAATTAIAKGKLAFTLTDARAEAEKDGYTVVTKEALNTAISEAEALLSSTSTELTSQDYNDAAEALYSAIAGLKKSADKTLLKQRIDSAAIIELTGYTEASANAFTAALNNANTAYNNTEIDQADVDTAANNLWNAMLGLTVEGTINRNFLNQAITDCSGLTEADYTVTSWTAFKTAYDAAVALSAAAAEDPKAGDYAEETDPEAAFAEALALRQKAVDDAVDAIDAAYKALVLAADFTELKALIAEVKALNKADYMASSLTALDAPLAAAEEAIEASETAEFSKTQVDALVTALKEAVAALVTKRHNVLLIADSAQEATNKNYGGIGNVFYYDYHEYVAEKNLTPGAAFPADKTLDKAGDQGNADYVLRLGTIAGEGTTSAADGDKLSSAFSHARKDVVINGTTYGHAFGYCFYNAVTVDKVTFHLPTNTDIASIDVYGAVRTTENGKTLYGKVSPAEETAGDKATPMTYLGTFAVPDAQSGAASIIVSGDLTEAYRAEYIYFAVKFDDGTSGHYKFYEIEVFGLLDTAVAPSDAKAADFSALKTQYADYKTRVQADYTAESWAKLVEALKTTDPVNKSVLSTAEKIAAAAATLKTALAQLELKPSDKTKLQEAITKAKATENNGYTPKTWDALQAALKTAETVNATDKIAQSEIDATVKALNDAIAGLRTKGDLTALKAALEKANELDEAYFQGSAVAWNMFRAAVEKGEALLTDENADQETIDKVAADIGYRQSNLILTPGMEWPPAEEETADVETNEATEEETPAEEEDSGCGGCGSSAAVSAIAIVGVIGAAVALKKKED